MDMISGKSTMISQLVIFRGYTLRREIQIALDEEDDYAKSRSIIINTNTESQDVAITEVSCTAHSEGGRGGAHHQLNCLEANGIPKNTMDGISTHNHNSGTKVLAADKPNLSNHNSDHRKTKQIDVTAFTSLPDQLLQPEELT